MRPAPVGHRAARRLIGDKRKIGRGNGGARGHHVERTAVGGGESQLQRGGGALVIEALGVKIQQLYFFHRFFEIMLRRMFRRGEERGRCFRGFGDGRRAEGQLGLRR